GALFSAGFGVPTIGPGAFPYLASWNVTNSVANWEMAPEGTATDAGVSWGFAFFDDALYAGTLDAFNAVTGAELAWRYPVSPDHWGSIRAIASSDDSLFVAGNFNAVSGPPLANL